MTNDELYTDLCGTAEACAGPFNLAERLAERVAPKFTEMGCERRDDIIATALQVYQKYVAPFDIPGVPNIVEPAIDSAIGMALEQVLETAADLICGSN